MSSGNRKTKKVLNKVRTNQGQKETKSIENNESVEDPKVHPWRLCPIGRHWVRTHPMSVEPSEKNPEGETIRHGHCANNPNRGKGKKAKNVHDYIEPHEMDEIAKDRLDKILERSFPTF